MDGTCTYAIYGANRAARDFLYIFDDMRPVCVMDRAVLGKEWNGLPMVSLEEGLLRRDFDQILVCGFEKGEAARELLEKGLKEGKDWIWAGDWIDRAEPEDFQGKRLILWGAGKKGEEFMEWNRRRGYEISCVVDRDPGKQTFYGIPVVRPEEIGDWKDVFVIIAVAKDLEIRSFLERAGGRNADIAEYRMGWGGIKKGDFINFEELRNDWRSLLKRTLFDRACYGFSCDTMLNHMEVVNGGRCRCCCTTFVRENIGNILDEPVGAVWGSRLHKILCLSSQNRTYSFCDKEMCPLFIGREADGELPDGPYRKAAPMPEVLALGYDPSCNLKCGTCREEVYVLKDEALELACRISEKIRPAVEGCRFLIMAGDGEVFASRAYRQVYEGLEEGGPGFVRLLSNGTLFSERTWEGFRKKARGKIMATFSIDGATKETYEAVRRGGSFEGLKRNMEYAARLRKSGQLSYFRLNFVVQRRNFREMPLFVQWGLELGADEVFFTKLLNWGTYTDEEFREVSMMEEDGVTPKPELEEVLGHPLMKNQIVDLGTIRCHREPSSVPSIHNYYMWELERKVPGLFTKSEG